MPRDTGRRAGVYVKEVKDACQKRLEMRRFRSGQKRMNVDSTEDHNSRYNPLLRVSSCDSGRNEENDPKQREYVHDSLSMHTLTSPPTSSNNDAGTEISISSRRSRNEDESRGGGGVAESYGSVSVCGRRREMEDAVRVALGFLTTNSFIGTYDFFAVYDGHGGSGVAEACRDRLHRIIAEEIIGGDDGGEGHEEVVVDWEKVMRVCFSRMDDEITGKDGEDGNESGSMKTVGTTAVVAVVGAEEVVVANCGDSRAVLSRGGVAVPMSRDHKPDRPDEMERVEAAGGRVINWNGYRVLGVLATSRSIGDYYLKPYVIPNPEVMIIERTEDEEFLILASDGLWDVMSNEAACQVVRKCLSGRLIRRCPGVVIENVATEAAAVLVELAMARGSQDNISVIVVELNKV